MTVRLLNVLGASTRLASLSCSRDNNFNLIRLVAAASVLVSHSFALVYGKSLLEPLQNSIGMSLGAIAVDIFFVCSGYLVGGSLLTKNSPAGYVAARILRIFPALWGVIFLTVFVLGPSISDSTTTEYFFQSKVWEYLVKNLIVVFGVSYSLPGVFSENPYGNAVNGSLWTLPYELWMYGILFVVWTFYRHFFRYDARNFGILVTLLLVLAFSHFFGLIGGASVTPIFSRLFYFFFSGVAYWLFRNRIFLSYRNVLLLLLACVGSVVCHEKLFLFVYSIALPYAVLFFAYVPRGAIRIVNNYGDYSYGLYVMAFPIQQIIVQVVPGITPMTLSLYSFAVVFPLAVLSWHAIESKALNNKEELKRSISGWTNLLRRYVRSKSAS